MFRFLIYLAIASVYVYSLTYDILYLPILKGGSWFFRLRFLTQLNFVVSTFYYVLCTVRAMVDFLSRRKQEQLDQAASAAASGGRLRRQRSISTAFPSYYSPTPLHKLCDFMYSTLAFPFGLAVVCLFWGIYAVDRELVYPKSLDKVFPHWINQVWHTAPIPFTLVDTLLVCHRYPSKTKGCLLIAVLAVAYCSNIFYTKYSHGFWLYPIFDAFGPMEMGLFCVFASSYVVAMFMIGYGLNSLVWGEASHPRKALGTIEETAESRRIKSRLD